jgi:hypothetical protein
MKHWIIGGTVAIAATVLLFRTRTSTEQTIDPPSTGTVTTPGIAWPPTSRITRDPPANAPPPQATTTRGVPIQSLPNLKIAPPATRPAEASP